MKTYTIKQFAELIGVSVRTLQRWDKEGKLKPSLRTVGGHRRYTEEQLKEVQGDV